MSKYIGGFLFPFWINNYMQPNPLNKIYLRIFFYMVITMLISFFSLIDTMDIEKLKALTNIEWIKIAIKSSLPALISLKAYFDDSATLKNTDNGGSNGNPQ